MAIAVLGLVLAPAASAARPPADPVLTAISQALAAKNVTPAKAATYRRAWADSARAIRTARSKDRRSNIAAVRSYATTLARRRGLTAPRLEQVFLSIRATTTVLNSRRAFPRHEQELRIPRDPLVYTYYAGRGVQYQPFETFKLGVSYLAAEPAKLGAARQLADRMLELGTTDRGSLTWEFFFPFGGPATPWRSTIAQALGLRMYSLLAQQTTDPTQQARYLAAADAIVQSFARTPAARGVSVPEGDGSFYVMYSFNPAQRILNGHLQALLSLERYVAQTGSPAAQDAYERGYTAVVPMLPRFDTGDWSNYQPGQEADREYHAFMTDELRDLARETQDPVFTDYARRFRIYLEDPASLGLRAVLLPSLVLPRGDAYRDTIPVRFELNKSARVTLIIADAAGIEQQRITSRAARGINTMYWNGLTAAGVPAPEGSYSGRFVVVDRFGRRSTTTIDLPLVIEADTVAPVPFQATYTDVDGGASTQVLFNVTETASRWYEGQLAIDGETITGVLRIKSGPITFTVSRPRAELERATLRLVDNSGNESVTPLASVPVATP